MRRLFPWLSSVPVLLSLGSCAVNPVSGKQQFNLRSEQQEVAAECESLKPLRIRLQKLDRRTTCRDLAKGSPLGPDAESVLRLINGDWPAGEPERRHTVKLVR